MNLIFVGPPGSGKGTVADEISSEFGLQHVSIGELMRKEIAKGTELGKAMSEFTSKGALVPNQVTIKFVNQALKAFRGNFILDGYPRDVEQAESLVKNVKIDAILLFECSDKVIIKRLSSRMQCANGHIYGLDFPPKKKGFCDTDNLPLKRRADDEPESIQKRLDIYREVSFPVIKFFESKVKILSIDSSVSPKDLFESARKALSSLKN